MDDAWIPQAPPNVSALAGYMTIANGTGAPRRLVGASSADFKRIEIHRTRYEQESGLARMDYLREVEVDAGMSLKFEPGSYHLMMMGPGRALAEGDLVAVTLRFADGAQVTVDFQVRREQLRL